MEDDEITHWLELPAGMGFVPFSGLARLIARAQNPVAEADEFDFDYHGARMNLEEELPKAVAANLLVVRNPKGYGLHTLPYGAALQSAVVKVSDLRAFLADRSMGVRVRGKAEARGIDWGAYSMRDGFTLFELACLLHRLEPRAALDDAHEAIHRRGGVAAEVLRDPAAAAEMLHMKPAEFFAPPVGDTLERLKRAAGSRLGLTVNADRARALAAMLGVPYPPELQRGAPAASPTPETAPAVVADGGPLPLTTGDVAFCFDGLRHWDQAGWKRTLGNKPKWLQACVAIPGRRGISETRWNPVCIGGALVTDGQGTSRSVRARFQRQPLLQPWLEAWKTYEADYLDSD